MIISPAKIFNYLVVPSFVFITILPPLLNGHLLAEIYLPFFVIVLMYYSVARNIEYPDKVLILLILLLNISFYISKIYYGFNPYNIVLTGYIYGTTYLYGSYIVIFVAAYNFANKNTHKLFMASIVIVGTLISIIGIFQFFNLFNVPTLIDRYYSTMTLTSDVNAVNEYRFRVTSVMDSNPHLLGGFLLWPIFILIISILEEDNILFKFVFIALLMINIICLLLSFAKTAIAIFLTLSVFMILAKRRYLLFFSILLVLLIFISSFSSLTEHSQFGYLARGYKVILSENIGQATSLQGRFYFWSYIFESLDELSILIGGGPYLAEKIKADDIYADSSYVYYLLHGGIISLLLFLSIKLIVLVKAYKLNKIKYIRKSEVIFYNYFFYYYIACLVLFATSGIGSTYIKWSYLFWFQLGILLKSFSDTHLLHRYYPLVQKTKCCP